MSLGEEHYVCSLTLVMRTRLLCGLYCRRAVHPCLRPLAQVYCLALPIAFWLFIYYINVNEMSKLSLFNWTIGFGQHFFASIISLWTGDEYIHTYFTQNKLTDVSLDSPMVFNRLQRQIRRNYCFGVVGYCVVHFGLNLALGHGIEDIGPVRDLFVSCSCFSKVLVMGLFNSRILVLRRRLERYGFRIVGGAQPQPYCQIYDKILQDLNETDNPLKLLVFFNLIFSCCRIICSVISLADGVLHKQHQQLESFLLVIHLAATTIHNIFDGFAHVAMLESAAAHCEDMVVFTVTQLIKNPTADERRRMHQFLDALQNHGARYRLLRALPCDARLLLQALGFCFAQVIILYKILDPY